MDYLPGLAPLADDAAPPAPAAAGPAAVTAVPDLSGQLPPDWRDALPPELLAEVFPPLQEFLAAECRAHAVFPPPDRLFSAFRLTPFRAVRAVILGQDPYHDDGQAHGLAFSVLPGVPPPPSLRNIFKERQADLGLPPPAAGCLDAWARQGVLLLNTVLTVRAHAAGSHQGRGWERFTDGVIRALNARSEPVVFVLWGGPAQKKLALIDAARHPVLTAPHPSPLSAHRGFLGSRPFSGVNARLAALGRPPVDWQLPA